MVKQLESQENHSSAPSPGRVVLFGSGETSPTGRKVHARLFAMLAPPVRVAILETPAGFQPNSAIVAGEVADFIQHHLQNHEPQVTIVPARKKGTGLSPDDPAIVAPLLRANYLFLGPGSPTYTVRNLEDTLAWRYILAGQRRGAVLCLASAASIAAGAYTLPVYEIYKAGHDQHWSSGLDFFGNYGLELAIIPHWNNSDGGEKLDTSRCFMGRDRMRRLAAMLPATATLLGLDEHTAIIFDFVASRCEVVGKSAVTIRSGGDERVFQAGTTFPMGLLGPARIPPLRDQELPVGAVEVPAEAEPTLPADVRVLIVRREKARLDRNWHTADQLRDRVASLGFEIQDTPNGPRWRRQGDQTAWQQFELAVQKSP